MDQNLESAPVATPVANVTPVAAATAVDNLPENSVAQKLFLAVREVEGEVKKIDLIISELLAESEQKVAKLRVQKEELFKLLHQYGSSSPAAKKATTAKPKHPKRKGPAPGSPSRKAAPGEKTIPELIMEYMESNNSYTGF